MWRRSDVVAGTQLAAPQRERRVELEEARVVDHALAPRAARRSCRRRRPPGSGPARRRPAVAVERLEGRVDRRTARRRWRAARQRRRCGGTSAWAGRRGGSAGRPGRPIRCAAPRGSSAAVLHGGRARRALAAARAHRARRIAAVAPGGGPLGGTGSGLRASGSIGSAQAAAAGRPRSASARARSARRRGTLLARRAAGPRRCGRAIRAAPLLGSQQQVETAGRPHRGRR